MVAVNKMDLVDYSPRVFAELDRDLQSLRRSWGFPGLAFIPISALYGDNVVERGMRMPWYEGPTLLEYLETVPTPGMMGPTRPSVCPFSASYGLTRTIAALPGRSHPASIWPGDRVIALPFGQDPAGKKHHHLRRRSAAGGARLCPLPSRWKMSWISAAEKCWPPRTRPRWWPRTFFAAVVWMNAEPLDSDKIYLLKHTSQTVKARVQNDSASGQYAALEPEPAATLELNSIGVVEVETTRPLFLDTYEAPAA